tara:strand:+ start:2236 stop:2430 length:195 start_codon:yes stop_codon:yes gene_type:complete
MYWDEILVAFTYYYYEMLAHDVSLCHSPSLPEDVLLFPAELDLRRHLDVYPSLMAINSPVPSTK